MNRFLFLFLHYMPWFFIIIIIIMTVITYLSSIWSWWWWSMSSMNSFSHSNRNLLWPTTLFVGRRKKITRKKISKSKFFILFCWKKLIKFKFQIQNTKKIHKKNFTVNFLSLWHHFLMDAIGFGNFFQKQREKGRPFGLSWFFLF